MKYGRAGKGGREVTNAEKSRLKSKWLFDNNVCVSIGGSWVP